jgi:hypothetical protein
VSDKVLDKLPLHPLVDQHQVRSIGRPAAQGKPGLDQVLCGGIQVGISLDNGHNAGFGIRNKVMREVGAVGTILQDADVAVGKVGVGDLGLCCVEDVAIQSVPDEVEHQPGCLERRLFRLNDDTVPGCQRRNQGGHETGEEGMLGGVDDNNSNSFPPIRSTDSPRDGILVVESFVGVERGVSIGQLSHGKPVLRLHLGLRMAGIACNSIPYRIGTVGQGIVELLQLDFAEYGIQRPAINGRRPDVIEGSSHGWDWSYWTARFVLFFFSFLF